jgi:hypothetical protein
MLEPFEPAFLPERRSMKRIAAASVMASALFALGVGRATGGAVPEFRDLFNGKDLTGWVNVNTARIPGKFAMAC